MTCASLNRAVFIKNLLRYLAKKILLLKTTGFRGDYPPGKLKAAVSRLGSDIKEGVMVEDAVQNFKDVIGNTGPFTMKQNGLLARHDTAVVQSFWQDL